MKIKVKQGQIVINSVWMTHQADDMICFTADCKSKYPAYEGGGETDLYFGARDCSLGVDRDAEFTIMEFTLPDIETGWTSLVETGRYYIHIVFVPSRCLSPKDNPEPIYWRALDGS